MSAFKIVCALLKQCILFKKDESVETKKSSVVTTKSNFACQLKIIGSRRGFTKLV